MTTPGKNFPALPAFLPTPDSIPETSACRTFSIPDNDDWLGLLMGALNILSQEWAYYPYGSLTESEAAAKWNDIINQAYADSITPGSCVEVPAPFWDETSGDDTPMEAPANAQDWYGRWDGETFLESVSYVFLSGFLARLVGAQAAIKFLTIPRAFRVTVRQNPHGANLLLFLDGGLYKVINGYSPFDKIAEFLIASPGTELLLVVDDTHDPDSTPDSNGNYVVDVIRTRLAESDVTPPNTRYDGTPPVFQTSYDDGATWVDTPNQDVRYSSFAQFPPLTPGTGVICDAAERMTQQLKDCIHLMCTVADAAQAVTGLLELILLPEGLVGVLLSLFFTICDWIIDNGQATILAAFTDTVYDDIKCELFCRINVDGTITQANLDAAWDAVQAAHTGTVATVIGEVRFLFTDVVFSNAATQRTETGDCSACPGGDFCHVWGASGTPFDAAFNWTASFTGGFGTIVSGVWTGVNTSSPSTNLIIELAPGAPFTLDTLELTWSNHDNNGDRPDCILFLAGTQVARIDISRAVHASDDNTVSTFSFGGVDCDKVELVNIANDSGILVNITKIKMSGSGACGLFGGDNC